MNGFQKKTGRIMLILTFIFLVLSLLIFLIPYLSSGRYWFIAILGLGFPYIYLLIILLLVFWVIRKSKWIILPLAALLINIKQILVVLAINKGNNGTSVERKVGSLRVMSWNVSRWDERNKEKRGGQSYRNLMFDFIEVENPDVLCLQEFFECHDPQYYDANIPVLQKMGYTYYHFFPSFQLFDGKFQYGLAIFSKYPITKKGSFLNDARQHSEGIIFCDINFEGKHLRLFNTHPESPGFGKEDFTSQGGISPSKGLLQKLKKSYGYRNAQVISATEIIRQSPYPVILCADLGDVPNSYAYFKLKKGLKDAFLSRGNGLGRTYRFLLPHLRIDYIFVSKELLPYNYYIPKIVYSDHYPQIIDIISE